MATSTGNFRKTILFTRGGVALLLVNLLLSGCHAKMGTDTQSRGQINTMLIRRGLGGEPATLDPGQAGDTFSDDVIRDLYEGLATESSAGDILPGVAESWDVDPSATEYTFHLRHDAKWSNGLAVRAQDFVNSWRRVVDPRRASPVTDFLRPIANAAQIISGGLPASQLGVYAARDDLLVVRLRQPTPYFLQLLTHTATFPIYSEESAAAHTPHNWISNGPYVLASWTPGGSLKLRKNLQYWDRSNTRIEQVEYLPITDENSELAQYRAGQIDITKSIPSSALPLLLKEHPTEMLIAPYLGTVYCAINLRSHENLDVKTRQALAMAIDRHALQKTILSFGQEPAYGFVSPGTWNYEPQSWAWKALPDSDRLAQAQALYRAAGYTSSKPLRLRFLYNQNSAIKQLAIAIASMWREALGVETELIDEEYRVFLDSRKDKSRWDIARLAWVADYNDAGNFLDIFRHGSPNNDAAYENREFDSLLDDAERTPDPENRRKFLENAERLMLSEYPVIPIYFYTSKRLIKPYVKGVRANPLNRLYSKHLYFEP